MKCLTKRCRYLTNYIKYCKQKENYFFKKRIKDIQRGYDLGLITKRIFVNYELKCSTSWQNANRIETIKI